jgi:hypothetical protein
MKLDFAIFAKAAVLEPSGVFSVLAGGLDVLEVPCLPAVVPSLCLLVRILAESNDEQGVHRLRVEAFDPDGQRAAVEADSTFRLPPGDGEFAALPKATVIFTMQDLQLPRVGRYTFRVFIDGNRTGEVGRRECQEQFLREARVSGTVSRGESVRNSFYLK